MQNYLITFLASFLIWILFGSLLILWFIDGRIKKEQVLHALFAIFVTWIIAEVIKTLFPTLRPFLLNGERPLTLVVPDDGAFPSFHAMSAFALSVTIFMHDRKLGAIYLILAGFVGIARIMANVHYPVDVIGGALLGTLIAVITERLHLFKFLSKAKK